MYTVDSRLLSHLENTTISMPDPENIVSQPGYDAKKVGGRCSEVWSVKQCLIELILWRMYFSSPYANMSEYVHKLT